MVRYVARRLLQAAVVLALVTVLVFLIARISGNPVDVMVPIGAPASLRRQITHQMGLDQPLPVQFLRFVGGAVHGDFGMSTRFQEPAMQLVLEHLPNTIELALAATLLAMVVGVPLGVVAALRRGGAVDAAIGVVSTFGQAVPSFWLGILLILLFGVRLGWLPVAGQSGPASLIMPAVSLAVIPLVSILRLSRSSVIEVLQRDFVRTARAKGLRRLAVIGRHVLPNGLASVIAFTGILIGGLLGGAVITEQIFAWPGVGQLAIQSIEARDYAVVQALTVLTATMVVVMNLLADLAHLAIDPRVRASATGGGR